MAKITTLTKTKSPQKKAAPQTKVSAGKAKVVSAQNTHQKQDVKQVLNVGGGSKDIAIPDIYNGWNHILLDIDSKGKPDVVCDARNLKTLPAESYDAVYCSHNLEHYHYHDVQKVLQGFLHLVKDDGFVQIRVPNIQQLMQIVVEKNLDIDDFLYQSSMGPILVRDVLYGHGGEIETSGNDYYAHKTGFSPASLQKALFQVGFKNVFLGNGQLEIIAIAFKGEPSVYAKKLLFNQ